jgi:hypothetical protein
MALVSCPACGHRVSDAATVCPSCGHPMERKPAAVAASSAQQKNVSGERTALGCLGIVAFFAFAGFLSIAIARAPWLRYLLLVLGVAVAGAAIANRPPEVRRLLAAHTKLVVFLGAVLVIGGLIGQGQVTKQHEQEQAAAAQREAAQVAAEQRAKAEKEREAQLRQNAGAAAGTVKALTADLNAALSSERWDDVQAAMVAVNREADPYTKISDLPPAMTDALVGAKQALAAGEPVVRARELLRAAVQELETGKSQQGTQDFVAARIAYQRVPIILNGLPVEGRRYVPEQEPLIVQASSRERRVNGKAEQQLKKRQREEAKAAKEKAEQEALWAVCGGQPPTRSGWDNAYYGVERHLKQTAHDPDSIDVETCSTAVLTDGCWRTSCVYRGKNGFGALIRKESTFFIARENTVIGMK